ncbi:Transposase [Mucisphaera calidilacus]|uniref:Transposase n=1 Tax=Mucisphaera calidilacus TaxID=2527982 RepID=A0A518BX41_9BACT|nr:Transposase [Mucisphaera calidilacus]
MSRKRHSAEEIVNKLREADVLLGQGRTVAQACRQLGVGEQTYYRWRREYGGMKVDQARKFKELERENARLRKPASVYRRLWAESWGKVIRGSPATRLRQSESPWSRRSGADARLWRWLCPTRVPHRQR